MARELPATILPITFMSNPLSARGAGQQFLHRFGVREPFAPHLVELAQERAIAQAIFVPAADEPSHSVRVGSQMPRGEVTGRAQLSGLTKNSQLPDLQTVGNGTELRTGKPGVPRCATVAQVVQQHQEV
jgi:hypothetical protein